MSVSQLLWPPIYVSSALYAGRSGLQRVGLSGIDTSAYESNFIFMKQYHLCGSGRVAACAVTLSQHHPAFVAMFGSKGGTAASAHDFAVGINEAKASQARATYIALTVWYDLESIFRARLAKEVGLTTVIVEATRLHGLTHATAGLLATSPSPGDRTRSRMPPSA